VNNLQGGNNAALQAHPGDRNRLRRRRRTSDTAAKNYQEYLSGALQCAAQNLSLRTIKAARVESVSVTEIKDEL
jgi:hypothetical protein